MYIFIHVTWAHDYPSMDLIRPKPGPGPDYQLCPTRGSVPGWVI